MNVIIIFLLMIFCHIVDDYYLQGILAQLKQKKYWQQNTPNPFFYRYDYIVALLMHSFSWTFMILLPILIAFSFNPPIVIFIIIFIINFIIHAIVDDLKANKLKINLVIDQLCHIGQIIVSFVVFVFYLI